MGKPVNIYPSTDNFFLNNLDQNSGNASVFEDGVLYPFNFSFKSNVEKIIFFLPGAFDRKRQMPKFQRVSYFTELDNCHCISLFDPSLFQSSDLSIAWFQGNEEKFYIDGLIKLVKSIVSNLQIKNENILFFGTSAGGIPSFNLAKEFSGCNVFAGNIQTNALLFYPSSVEKLLKTCYAGKSKEEVFSRYKERVSIDHIICDFNLFYVQNVFDKYHHKLFFKPFSESHKNIKGQLIEYSHEKSGHNPVSKEVEIAAIKCIFSGGSLDDVYRNI